MILWYPSANRDELVFDAPDRFDLTRSPNLHLAFGVGPHFCLGARIGRLQMDVMLREMLTRLPSIDVTTPGPLKLPEQREVAWCQHMTPGDLIAAGRTSEVHAYGDDSVIKILRAEVPGHWAELEAHLTRAVRSLGVPAPEMRDVVTVDGRPAIVFERIHGPSMWQLMCDDPIQIAPLGIELARIHRQIQRAGLPEDVPDLVNRLCSKIDDAPHLTADEQHEAATLVNTLPRGAALLHGDLHPGNVLMGATGPIVIDWFDATIGHPVADIVRSSILLRPDEQSHLPGATPAQLAELHQVYVEQFSGDLARAEADLQRWESVIAAGRLAEGVEADASNLLGLWRARSTTQAPEMLTQALAS